MVAVASALAVASPMPDVPPTNTAVGLWDHVVEAFDAFTSERDGLEDIAEGDVVVGEKALVEGDEVVGGKALVEKNRLDLTWPPYIQILVKATPGS